QWVVSDLGNGYHSLKSVNSGKCMDIAGGSSTVHNGANLHQWTCHGGYNQQFRLIRQSNGSYQAQVRSSGKCLDVAGGSTANGATLHQWDCHSGNNQRFLFTSVGDAPTSNPPTGTCNY